MLARKQELNTQLQQLIDAFLVALSLYLAIPSVRPALIQYVLVRSFEHHRSIPKLSMAFRGSDAVRANHARSPGLLSIAP